MSRATPTAMFLVFGWLGLVSIGGGLSIIPEMHRELVDVQGWLSPRAFADGYAIGQLAPGPNMLAVVFYGYAVGGVGGGILAAGVTITPGSLLAAVAGGAWSRLENNTFVSWVRRGLIPVGFGLMVAGVFVLARDTMTDWMRILLALAVLASVRTKRVHPAIAVVTAGAVGLAWELLHPSLVK